MSKKRRKKTITPLAKTVEIKDIPNPDYELKSQEDQHFELFPFPLVSLYEDYNAYRIVIEGKKQLLDILDYLSNPVNSTM